MQLLSSLSRSKVWLSDILPISNHTRYLQFITKGFLVWETGDRQQTTGSELSDQGIKRHYPDCLARNQEALRIYGEK